MLDDELALVLAEELPTAARNAEALLETYSALLIYTGSPTREVYHRLIRPAMALQHRSFSGRWAQDYVPVMAKLQALRKAYRAQPRPELIESLISASKRNHRTHVAVAAKLVPDDDSLLRGHDGGSLAQPNPELVRLYDAFYSTVRTLVPRENVVTQFLTRLRAILWDLRTNGLYPQGLEPARVSHGDMDAGAHPLWRRTSRASCGVGRPRSPPFASSRRHGDRPRVGVPVA
jgi:hypothetical protein